jgi:hypothetical protein
LPEESACWPPEPSPVELLELPELLELLKLLKLLELLEPEPERSLFWHPGCGPVSSPDPAGWPLLSAHVCPAPWSPPVDADAAVLIPSTSKPLVRNAPIRSFHMNASCICLRVPFRGPEFVALEQSSVTA